MGILSCEQLLQTPTDVIQAKLPASDVDKLKLCARSYVEQCTIVFGRIPPIGSSYIVLDIEIVPINGSFFIYLIGMCVVTGDERNYHSLWAASEQEEKDALERFAGFLEKHKQLPIITWDGTKHDLPKLQNEARRLKVEWPKSAFAQHRDLFKEFDNAVRFPSRRFRLEDVAMWLSFTGERVARYVKRHGSMPKGEDDAWKVCDEYVRCGHLIAISEDQKKRLIECNRDDLDMLIWVSEKLPGLTVDEK